MNINPLPAVYAKWVKIDMLQYINGYTPDAVRGKIKKGTWRQDLHWKKAPDGNLMVNPKAIDEWIDNDGHIPERH